MVLAALPLTAAAQTNDVAFGGWRANPLTVGSRVAGMGGAFVAIADDARAAVVNPAGLTQIPLTELSVSSGRPWFAVAAGERRLRLAAYFNQAEQDSLPSDELARSTLQPSVWEAGLAVGVRPLRRFRVGATVAYRHLRVEEEGLETPGAAESHPLAERDDARIRVTAGALLDLVPASVVGASPLRLGVSFQPGVTFGVSPEGGEAVDIRRPSVSSIGLAWRASNAWSFTVQTD